MYRFIYENLYECIDSFAEIQVFTDVWILEVISQCHRINVS